MNAPAPPPALWDDAAQRRHARRNTTAMVLDGGFFGAALSFVAAETVLPSLVRDLGGANWLVALTPSMMMLGFIWSPLLTAHWVERLDRYHGVVLWNSVPQRLPSLFAAVALLLWGASHPHIALWFVALAPFLSGFFGGLTVTAFWQLLSKVVRPERRSSVLAWRSLIGTTCGFGAGYVISAVLAAHPGPRGYAILFLIQFVLLVLSFFAFSRIRELPHALPPRATRSSLASNLRAVPELVRTDPLLGRYIAARLCALGTLLITPFLAIHAREVLDAPKEFLGQLVSAQMLGAVSGNLLGAYLGDRHGGRLLTLLSTGGGVLLCLLAACNPWASGFLVIFFLLGATTFLQLNGTATLVLELFEGDRRPTYLSVISALTLPGVLTAAGLSTLLRDHVPTFWPAALAAAGLNFAAHRLFKSLPEPRRRG